MKGEGSAAAAVIQQLQKILDNNPFGQEHDISRVFFVLFAEPPSRENTKIILVHVIYP